MFLTYTDNDNQTVKVLAAEIAMLQSQRMMVRTGGEDTAYIETTGTRITLRSGREVWVNAHIDSVEADRLRPSVCDANFTRALENIDRALAERNRESDSLSHTAFRRVVGGK
jgi:hypothetical protein